MSTRVLPHSLPLQLRQAGWTIDEIPFISVHRREDPKLEQEIVSWSKEPLRVIFTSRHAVEAVTAILPSVPLWSLACLDGATREAVCRYWPEEAITATAEDAAALAGKIIAAAQSGPLVFFCGDQRLDHLPGLLNDAGYHLKERVVYETKATPGFVEKHYDAILFFSPSAVHSFFLRNDLAAQTVLFAIGPTTAACIQYYSKNKIVLASQPSAEAMIDKVIDHWPI